MNKEELVSEVTRMKLITGLTILKLEALKRKTYIQQNCIEKLIESGDRFFTFLKNKHYEDSQDCQKTRKNMKLG